MLLFYIETTTGLSESTVATCFVKRQCLCHLALGLACCKPFAASGFTVRGAAFVQEEGWLLPCRCLAQHVTTATPAACCLVLAVAKAMLKNVLKTSTSSHQHTLTRPMQGTSAQSGPPDHAGGCHHHRLLAAAVTFMWRPDCHRPSALWLLRGSRAGWGRA